MNYFNTLKDENVKKLFKVLMPEMYDSGGYSIADQIENLTFEERHDVFRVVHSCLKALGLANGDQPELFHSEHYYDTERNI